MKGASIAFVSFFVITASTIAAQPRDEVAAEALFVEGRRLMDQKQWSAATEKMRASDRAAPSVGARLSLAECLVELGKTASAWGAYRSAANLARRTQDPRRAEAAEKLARALEPKLSYVVIEVPAAARIDGLEITWDGAVRSPGLWGQRFPIDPGEHVVEARAPGFKTWNETLRIDAAGETAIKVPRLDGEGTAPAPVQPPEPSPRIERSTGDSRWTITTGRQVAIGLGVAGVIGALAGTGLAISARSKWNRATDDHCNGSLQCDTIGLELADEAGTAADRATIAFIFAGAALAGGAALWFIAAPDESPAITPIASEKLTGVAFTGRF